MQRATFVWMLVAPVAVHASDLANVVADAAWGARDAAASYAPASTLNQYAAEYLAVAGARGGVRGAIETPIPDDRMRLPIRWDMFCRENPLAKGCM